MAFSEYMNFAVKNGFWNNSCLGNNHTLLGNCYRLCIENGASIFKHLPESASAKINKAKIVFLEKIIWLKVKLKVSYSQKE